MVVKRGSRGTYRRARIILVPPPLLPLLSRRALLLRTKLDLEFGDLSDVHVNVASFHRRQNVGDVTGEQVGEATGVIAAAQSVEIQEEGGRGRGGQREGARE